MSNRKVKVAMIGLGFGAEFIPIYQNHPHAEIYAICQRNPEKLKKVGDDFGIDKRYTDYAAEKWPGPPDNAIAYWTGRVPPTDRPQKPVINDELLLDCFSRLADAVEPNQIRFRYVVSLLLMRRKRMKFEDAKRDANGQDVLVLRDAKTGDRFEILDPRLNEDETATVQDEVFQMLGWNG